MAGKHTSEAQKIKSLEDTVKLMNREISEIKTECADQFKKIYEISTQNDFGNKDVKIRKMAEIAKDNFDILLKDMLIESEKIIELPTTNQSNK